jgi:diguanylate cyclase (GGDEF)-like protein
MRPGDDLLRSVAHRLLTSTRDADTTSRYGGDEFIILLSDVEGAKGATEVAEVIHACLAEPFLIHGHSIEITTCIGIAIYPLHGTTADDLIGRADTAMYLAKQEAAPGAESSRTGHAPGVLIPLRNRTPKTAASSSR